MPLDCGFPDPALVNYAAFSCPEGTSFLQRCSISCVPPAKLQGIIQSTRPCVQGPFSPSFPEDTLRIFPSPPILFSCILLDHPLLITPAKSTLLVPTTRKDSWLRISLQRHSSNFLFDCMSFGVKPTSSVLILLRIKLYFFMHILKFNIYTHPKGVMLLVLVHRWECSYKICSWFYC